METYQLLCTCGEVMEVNAKSREDAVRKLQRVMNQSAVVMHFREKHVGDEVPTVEQVHAMIAENMEAIPMM